jgi:hypothetical protein
MTLPRIQENRTRIGFSGNFIPGPIPSGPESGADFSPGPNSWADRLFALTLHWKLVSVVLTSFNLNFVWDEPPTYAAAVVAYLSATFVKPYQAVVEHVRPDQT